jgi:hypothetical protein
VMVKVLIKKVHKQQKQLQQLTTRYEDQDQIILVNDLHDLFKMPPKQLGHYILAKDRKRSKILGI